MPLSSPLYWRRRRQGDREVPVAIVFAATPGCT
jgi:hypothetical protein